MAFGESCKVQRRTTNEAGKRRIMPGTVQVWVGGGQLISRTGLPKAVGVQTQFVMTSEATLPD